jgi:hypothetical protein
LFLRVGSFPQTSFPGPPNQYIPPPPYRPPQNQAPPIDDLSLAFDNLARALRATAGPPEIDNFQMSLGMLMHDCSQSNIQVLFFTYFFSQIIWQF